MNDLDEARAAFLHLLLEHACDELEKADPYLQGVIQTKIDATITVPPSLRTIAQIQSDVKKALLLGTPMPHEVERIEIVPLPPMPPLPVDELGKRRTEKQLREELAKVAKSVASEYDGVLKHVTDVATLEVYRQVAHELRLLGQGIEDVGAGMWNGIPIVLDLNIAPDVIVFYGMRDGRRETASKLLAGYDVVKQLLQNQPLSTRELPTREDALRDRGKQCWRCYGTGWLSRTYEVQDTPCPQCGGRGYVP